MQKSYTPMEKSFQPAVAVKGPVRQEASKSPLQRKFEAFKRRYKVQAEKP